jgi:hypothetical protein
VSAAHGEFDDRTLERTLASLGVVNGPRVGAGQADAVPELRLPAALSRRCWGCVLAVKRCAPNGPTSLAVDFHALKRELYELYRLAS